MRIAAALIELSLPDAETIKAKRRVSNAVKSKLRQRFNLSTAEVADHDDRHSLCIGCVMVGVDPRHLRSQMEKAIRYVESLGLAEVIGDDIAVLRLDELEEEEHQDVLKLDWSRE
ncbi:MAG: DUF503 domain-containing protein [Myxococcota bacterium]|jgi:hypothetical protein